MVYLRASPRPDSVSVVISESVFLFIGQMCYREFTYDKTTPWSEIGDNLPIVIDSVTRFAEYRYGHRQAVFYTPDRTYITTVIGYGGMKNAIGAVEH
jgi:hypothetical protein